ncbi:MAG: dUTP diphosphatase [Bacteroidetes bacterium]|nr:dUTP diphosphatase [Bacteroidota bacterium]MBK9672528.1 dUTP diphosphatase [Bacteroidota bacterium]MBK9799818.1 dUTP diphosphatase [Bacteroidota bacterium]MBP6412917.1 dUTP diphosphatase [Bacteroidia bacterium]
MQVKIINQSSNALPEYATLASAGMDIRAFITQNIVLHPGERVLIPTGLFIELPVGTEAQIRPRSGLAFKNGVTVLNAPGTIDADYRGEIKVLLINLSKVDFTIQNGERIAQLIVAKHERVQWETVDNINETARGAGGFGHTGKV